MEQQIPQHVKEQIGEEIKSLVSIIEKTSKSSQDVTIMFEHVAHSLFKVYNLALSQPAEKSIDTCLNNLLNIATNINNTGIGADIVVIAEQIKMLFNNIPQPAEPYKVEFEENSETQETICWFTNPIYKGMVEAGKTKEEAFEQLMISLKVKLAFENNIDLLPAEPVSVDKSLEAFERALNKLGKEKVDKIVAKIDAMNLPETNNKPEPVWLKDDKPRILVTKKDNEELIKIRNIISSLDKTDETKIDYENIDMLEAINRALYNLKNGGNYYRKLPEREQKRLDCKCEECGWEGSSEYLLGGGQIADTGDYSDTYCPVCGSDKVDDEVPTAAPQQQYEWVNMKGVEANASMFIRKVGTDHPVFHEVQSKMCYHPETIDFSQYEYLRKN